MEWMKITTLEQKSFINDLKGLISKNSVRDESTITEEMPFGQGVHDAMNFMKELGIREGFKVKEYNGYALVLEYGQGEESIGVLGHLDIVPLGDGWTKEPLGGEIIDGYIFGRGVIDDKGPSISAFYAVKKIKEQAIELKKRILLIFGGDEESGMTCMDYYVKHGEIPTMGIVPDANFPAVYGEKGILRLEVESNYEGAIIEMNAGSRPNIVIGKANALVRSWNEKIQERFEFYLMANQLKGHFELVDEKARIFVEGIFSHAAWPYKGINAGIHLLNFVGAAYKDQVALHYAHTFSDWRGANANIDFEGAYMGFLTMNPGVITIENNTIAVTLDIRYPNDTSYSKILTGLESAVSSWPFEAKISTHEHLEPLFMDPNSKFIKTLENAYRRVSKDNFTPLQTMGGGTYARKLPNCVAFGPEFPLSTIETTEFLGGPHQKDEAMKLSDLYDAVEIYADVLVTLASEE